MAIPQQELFYRGYNPSLWSFGYDEPWIMQPIPAANAEKNKQQAATAQEKGVIELRMPLCCDGCVDKVQKKLKAMEGVASVTCDQEKQKVVVKGDAKPEAVLKKAKKILERSEFWNSKQKK